MKILRTAPFPRDNFGADYGGGIFNSGAQLEVIHCTLMRNSAKSYGNGIYIQDGGTLQLVNSIIWNEGGTAAQEIYFANLPGVSVINSIVRGGEYDANDEDPLLSWDGHLSVESPAINAAQTEAILADIEAELRPDGAASDLGADEFVDTDADGLPDAWETKMFGNLNATAAGDADGDGLNELGEYSHSTDPHKADSDEDGLNDKDEVDLGLSPLNPDMDEDGLKDGYEVTYGLDPLVADDLGSDADGDGLTLGVEADIGLNPLNADSDGDGFNDGTEIANGADPSDTGSAPPQGTPSIPPVPPTPPGPGDPPPPPPVPPPVPPTPPSPPSPPQGPTESGIDGLDLMVDVSEKSMPKYGYPTFQTTDPVKRYLKYQEISSLSGGCPESKVGGSLHSEIDPKTGEETKDRDPRHLSGSIRPTSPTYAQSNESVSSYDDPPNEKTDCPGTLSFTALLTKENTDQNVIDLTKAELPEYSGDYQELGSSGSQGFQAQGLMALEASQGDGTVVAYRDLWDNGLGFSYKKGKIKLKWKEDVAPEQRHAVKYLIAFRPEDDPKTPEDESKNVEIVGNPIEWDGQSAEFEVQPELDPDTLKPPLQPGKSDGSFILLHAKLVSDYNRDGKIDGRDRGKVTADSPWYWWINDDHDSGDMSGVDIPGDTSTPDGTQTTVQGTRDLEDYFPVFLDIKQLLSVLPPGQNTYLLKNADSNLRFVYTDLLPGNSRNYLTTFTGADLDNATTLAGVDAHWITSDGYMLSTDFLNKIINDGKGIILVEGRGSTTNPLVLEVDHGGQKICEFKFDVSIDGVEKMFRQVNLRDNVPNLMGTKKDAAPATNLSEPANLPDSLGSQKWNVFVIGSNVGGNASRGWNCEMFKRFYQSGSKAKFIGVSWFGDPYTNGESGCYDYHACEINAFRTAQSLANALNGLQPQGPITISAHSAGNIIVGSAIQDCNLSVDKFLMIDAAVALEAFDGSQTSSLSMIQPSWANYQTRTWTHLWHSNSALPSGDGRRTLTWNDRFSSVSNNAYNFYSSSEDVLRQQDGELDFNLFDGIGAWWTGGRYAWIYQEKMKGRRYTTMIAGGAHVGSTYGGWGFSHNFYDLPSGGTPPRPATMQETVQSSDQDLLAKPIFDPGFTIYAIYTSDNPPVFMQWNRTGNNAGAPAWVADLTDTTPGKASLAASNNQSQLLAEMIPAHTLPTGANSSAVLGDRGNLDMPGQFITDQTKWPRSDQFNGVLEWRHSDVKEVGYPHLYQAFDKMVDIGKLTE